MVIGYFLHELFVLNRYSEVLVRFYKISWTDFVTGKLGWLIKEGGILWGCSPFLFYKIKKRSKKCYKVNFVLLVYFSDSFLERQCKKKDHL